MKLEIDTKRARSGLTSLKAGIFNAEVLIIKAGIKAAEDSAKATTLWKDQTGETRKSIHGVFERGAYGPRGYVEAKGASYWLENGTRPHEIVARRKQALHFFVNGQEFFRKRVQHPGTAEKPFMAQARERGEMAVEYAADFYIQYAVDHAR